MSSAILKYTSKLNTNLQNIKKRIGEISKKSGEEKNRAILDLYTYFKRDTNVRVNLFTDAGETISRCLTVTECIHRDLEYLQSRCDKDLVGDERMEYCNGLVKQIGDELLGILDMVKRKAEIILQEPDIVDLFVEHLKTEKSEELGYLSQLLGKKLTRDNIYSYRSEIKNKLYQCYKGRNDRDTRIKWIVYGYIFGKNRRLEDWFPSVNSRFLEYDELLDKKVVDDSTIRFSQYNKKNLNGGLTQLEDTLKKYNTDNKNYKVYNRVINKEIDFSKYRDDLHSDVSYVYRDPDTDERLLTVIAPRSKYSAVYWGWDTKWCTARIDKGEKNIFKNNMFSEYYNDNDLERLYILQYKTNKYQLHFKSGQFMNAEDEPVELTDTELLLFGKWLKHFVKDKPNSSADILNFCIEYKFQYPVDFEKRYPNGLRIEYKNGVYKEYENEKITKEIPFSDGKINGIKKAWYRSGEKLQEYSFTDNKMNGVARTWHENGILYTEAYFKNDELNGVFKSWNIDGQLISENAYINGKLDGYYKEWHKNGQLKIDTTYVDDEIDGEYKEWDKDGKLIKQAIYKDGEPED